MIKINGTVRFYDPVKGFGFIKRDDGEDVFVHASALKKSGCPELSEGDKVSFMTKEGRKDKEEAYDITLIG